VKLQTGWAVGPDDVVAARGLVVLCTGSLPGGQTYSVTPGATVVDAAAFLGGEELAEGPVAVWDPIGGPVGVSIAESLRAGGVEVTLVTPDLLVGTMLARSGDLAPASVRLLGAGVRFEKRSTLTEVTPGSVTVVDHFSAETRHIDAVALVDAGARLPDDGLWRATGARLPRAGDAVAPRSAYEAVLEGRRVAQALVASPMAAVGVP
jgi:hypothetical protein